MSSYDRLCSTGKGSHQLSQHSQAQRCVSLSAIYIYTVSLTPETLDYTCVHEKFAQPSNQSAVLEKQAKMLSTSQRAQVLSKSKSGPIA